MALRIAEGREQLVREKRVVERIIKNVTSGVVSLDRGAPGAAANAWPPSCSTSR